MRICRWVLVGALVAGNSLATLAQNTTTLAAPQSAGSGQVKSRSLVWQAPLPVQGGDAYFTNLTNGDKIETPFVVKFGLSGGWGLAPIAKASAGKSGHHHLLVNRDLPLDFKKALPFSEQYIHFGKGQMETVLDLAPGDYNLRLLLADQNHLPHFVYSKQLKITVTKKNLTTPTGLVAPNISLNVSSTELKRPFRVQFHASGLNVGQLAQQEAGTGHFKLVISPKSGASAVELNFVSGETETWLEPPIGDYVLSLDFVDNLKPGRIVAQAEPKAVRVN